MTEAHHALTRKERRAEKKAMYQAQYDELVRQRDEKIAQEEALWGSLVIKGRFAGTTVWVYSKGYVRFDKKATPEPVERAELRTEGIRRRDDRRAGDRFFLGSAEGDVFLTIETSSGSRMLHTSGDVESAMKVGLRLETAINRVATWTPNQEEPPPEKPKPKRFDDRLRRLAQLHEDGILTDEEYASKKADILREF